MFDPFDELDHAMAKNMQWLNRPGKYILKFNKNEVFHFL